MQSLGERVADADAAELPSASGDPEHALARWRLVHAVHDAIASLDPACRELIVMRDLEGLTGEEACAALGLSEAAMKSRLHRARSELRNALLRRGDVMATRSR